MLLRGRADMRALLARFRADMSGLTLIESTFIMLILISLMVTGTEVQRYFRLARHMTAGGESLADLMGQRRAHGLASKYRRSGHLCALCADRP